MKPDVALATSVLGSGRLNIHNKRPFIDPRDGLPKVVVNGQVMRTNAPALLRYDEWKDIDRAVVKVAVQRLVAIGSLMSKGLVHPLGSIGNTISLYQKSSDMTPATVSMSPNSKTEKDTPGFDYATVPVPVVHRDFEVDIRRLEASRLMGESVDVTAAEISARNVAEKSEDLILNGNSSIVVDGGTIYGYTTHPDRNTVTLSKQWTHATKTGAEILADVQAMLAALRADNYYGPYELTIPGGYEGKLDDDFAPGTSDTRTVRERILQLSGIQSILVADRMTAHNVVLVQMTSDVVDLAMAQDITTVNWQDQGGLMEQFKVMAVWTPRVKSDYDGKSGVVHLS